MKKKFLIAAGVLLSLFAQNTSFAQDANEFTDVKGMNLLNAGVGLGSYGLYGTGGLPIAASFEHGFSKNISAGIETSIIQRKYADSWKYSYFIIGVRGSYHVNEALNISNPKVDLYGGAGLLYRRFKVKYLHDSSEDFLGKASSGDMVINLHAGGRYMFNKQVGAFAEVGYGISPLKLGVSLKF